MQFDAKSDLARVAKSAAVADSVRRGSEIGTGDRIDLPSRCVSDKWKGRKRDLLAEWRAHRQIGDGQFRAGERFVRLVQRAQMQGHAAIDVMGDRIDRTQSPAAATERILAAKAEMIALRQVLGVTDFALVCRVLVEGRDLTGAIVTDHGADHIDRHAGGDAERRYLAHRIRDALGMLAARFALDPEFT